MKNNNQQDLVISGVGVTASVGQGKDAFIAALLRGEHQFAKMQRPGRQLPQPEQGENPTPGREFLGAEIGELTLSGRLPASLLRTCSFSARVGAVTLDEAWQDAALEQYPGQRIGLIVGGSNFQQRELVLAQDKYRGKTQFLRPTYAMSYMDSDLCGMATEIFGIKGSAYSLGGASASGQLAVIKAAEAVQSGQVDVCIAVGALMDLSYWECQAFRSLGAMGSDDFADKPALAARPFDRDRNGFIYGESCGVVVVEKAETAAKRGLTPYARLAGWGLAMDGNRNPNPSFDGEVKVIEQALAMAGQEAQGIDYVNPHGTGSMIGDETELKALAHCGLAHARINTTKSVIGHGLSAAGAVEVIATLLQMKEGRLHPSRNLENPMDASFNWVYQQAVEHQIRTALNLSMGFGGINTAVCLSKAD